MAVSAHAPYPEPRDARERALQVVWEQHRAGVLEQVGLIERAIALLTTSELNEQFRNDARRCAHMLSGSLGMFGFARASEAARELELEFEHVARARAPTLSTLLAIVRHGLDRGIEPEEAWKLSLAASDSACS
jgi:two-component system OmpR family response regulator